MVSVVLPTFNGARTIRAQLDALLSQIFTGDWELVVVDNGSTDETAAMVEYYTAEHPHVRMVSAPDWHNLSYVRNVGASAAAGSLLAFVDDDDVVGETWLGAMAEGLRRWPLVACRLEYARLNPPEALVGGGRFQTERIESLFGMPVVSGAGFGCQRWVWEAVGGNDESFGATGEDFDFAMRVREATGVEPIFLPAAVYHYRLREGGRQAFRQARRHGESHVQLYRRHAPGAVPLWMNAAEALRAWWWIVTRSPLAAAGIRRERWSTETGRRVGRLVGSVKHRTWLL